jgi:hypothetical protein
MEQCHENLKIIFLLPNNFTVTAYCDTVSLKKILFNDHFACGIYITVKKAKRDAGPQNTWVTENSVIHIEGTGKIRQQHT